MANAIAFSGQQSFNSQPLVNYTVNGTVGGTFKTYDKLSFLRVFGAGHKVAYYQPQLALQAFEQTMMGKPLTGT